MRVIVLTGGLGSGKSTASEFFRARGAVVLDLDEVASHLLEPGSAELARVADEFGPDVLLADGRLDRAALARAAFASREATARLNAIVHPAVAREIGPAMADLRLLPQPPSVVVIEVPLLVEAPVYAEIADIVIALVAPEYLRVERAMADGMAESDARARIGVQASDAQRAALADVIIVNDRSKEMLLGELERFWDEHIAGTSG